MCDGFANFSCLMAGIVPSPFMDGGEIYLSLENWGSQTLRVLAKQLQVYKPPFVVEEPGNEADVICNSVSPGMEKPAAIKDDPFSYSVKCCRERRAAVLVCLFEGDEGELRVILTKRSMKLSSHPGNVTSELSWNWLIWSQFKIVCLKVASRKMFLFVTWYKLH